MYTLARLSLVVTLLAGCTGKEPPGGDTGPDPATTDADQDGSFANVDCDDNDAAVLPGADELCNDRDDDCDGLADEDAVDMATLYADLDGDTHGDPASAITSCDAPSGYVTAGDDCDDGDPAVSPSATELCDDADLDEDCSGAADDADANVDASTGSTWYADVDDDGYGDAATTATACDAVEGYVATAGDCDDASAAIHPDATELCDAADIDEDCDGLADDADDSADAATAATWFEDADGDGFGAPRSILLACDLPGGFVADSTDCDDTSSGISPASTESCDDLDVDEDCDGLADNDDPGAWGEVTWYADADADGFGDAAATFSACDQPEAYVSDATDCNDAAGTVYPAAAEQCDGVANDCDTSATWTTADEAGVASWIDTAGTWTEVTATLAAGTGDAPVEWTAPDDGELRLCDGTFYALIDGSGVALEISSLNGSDSTWIDGGGAGSVISSTGGTLSVQGVTVRNGAGSNGGGLYCLATDLIVSDAVFADNAASSSGGGLFLQACTDATLTDVEISGNTALNGGGLYASSSDGLVVDGLTVSTNAASVIGGGMVVSNSTFSIADSTVSGNAAGGSYAGGGLSITSSTGSLTGVTVSGNTASTAAGMLLSGSTVDLANGVVSDNTSSRYGAAIHAAYGATVTVESTTFSENVAGTLAPIAMDSSTGTFTSCMFTTNEGATAGVFAFEDGGVAAIVTSDFSGNTPNDVYAASTAYTLGTSASVTCDDSSGCL